MMEYQYVDSDGDERGDTRNGTYGTPSSKPGVRRAGSTASRPIAVSPNVRTPKQPVYNMGMGGADVTYAGGSQAPAPAGSLPRQDPAAGESLRPSKGQLATSNRVNTTYSPPSFGSSIAKPKAAGNSRAGGSQQSSQSYSAYIKPATAGAFAVAGAHHKASPFKTAVGPSSGYRDGWPSWAEPGAANPYLPTPPTVEETLVRPDKPKGEDDAEVFDLNAARVTNEDYDIVSGDAEEHMRELLADAVGDVDEGFAEGEDTVEGFANGVKLMPHQVRGVAWMKSRETGRKYGGILADDMGLGKTVQTLARVVSGKATAAEKKAGYKGTLIIAPLAVMEQWATECRTKTKPGALRVATHHGPSRAKRERELHRDKLTVVGKKLEEFDVVITTFQVVSSEYGNLVKGQPGGGKTKSKKKTAASESDDDSEEEFKVVKRKPAPHALFDVKWLRIVVDEAQNIKNHKTLAAKGAVELVAKYRWCLTGTPIQNNVEELFSLFKFLRAKPLDSWETFSSQISRNVKAGRTKIAMKRLHVILKAVMLRRTKDATLDGKPILNLPARVVQVVNCPFDDEERAFYAALEQRTALTFNKFLRNGTAMNNYTSVLSMLLRLRQACDHPSLVTSKLAADAEALESKTAADDEAEELADLLGGLGVAGGKKCEICFIALEDSSKTHCADCVLLSRKAEEQLVDKHPSSAKIRMLLDLVMAIEERSGKKEKTIVFSQFTSFLNLIEPFFKDAGVAYVRYDGSMRADKRQDVLETIKTDPKVRVILISFKAGSTGLNLTCCNNVILMDLWWNPALEDQAFDRAHRLGQKLDVNIYKLTIAETVEDRILKMQDSKRELAKAALSGGTIKNNKLTLNDMMKLFKSNAHEDD